MSITDEDQDQMEDQMIGKTSYAVSIQIEMLMAAQNALLARIERLPEEYSPEEYETLAVALNVSHIQSEALRNWLADQEDSQHDIVQRVAYTTLYDLKKHGFVVEIDRDGFNSGFVTLYWKEDGGFFESGFIGWKSTRSFEEHRKNLAAQGWVCSSWMVLPKDVAEHVATAVTPREWRSRLIDGEKAYTDRVTIWIKS
jgi:hypothetical protein